MEDLKLTVAEKKSIESLKKVAKTWPKSLWLFSGSGQLCVMKKPKEGSIMGENGGVDQRYIVDSISGIQNDGGDW